MTTIHDARPFIDSIDANPNDSFNLFAYADWLEDRDDGLDLREALRWMARRSVRPHLRSRYKHGAAIPISYRYGWYRDKRHAMQHDRFDPPVPHAAILPLRVFAPITSADHKYYASWWAAVADLAEALKQTREDVA